jgi:hypothetical protein
MAITLMKIKEALKVGWLHEWAWEDWRVWINAPSFLRVIPLLIGVSGLWCLWLIYTLWNPMIQAMRFNAADYTNSPSDLQLAPRVAIPSVAQYHIFGISANTQRVAQGSLELRGVFMGSTPENSTVVVGTIDQPDESLFSVNETLPDGSILVSIFEDHIVKDRNGVIENLFIKPDNVLELDQPDSAFISNSENPSNNGVSYDARQGSNEVEIIK